MSIYPRILIDDNIIEYLKQSNTNYNNSFQFIIKAPDGKYFIDYLDLLQDPIIDTWDIIQGHKNPD